MQKRRTVTWLGLIGLGLILALGFFAVLERRFAEGGLYPHYASFSVEPLGTSALYETLEALPDYDVSRNVKSLNQIKTVDGEATLLLLGYPQGSIDELRAPADSPVIEAVKEGGRLVIALNPGLVPEKYQPRTSEEEESWFERREELREKRIRESNREEDTTDSEEEERAFEKSMAESIGPKLTAKLGFEIADLEGFERPDEGWELTRGRSILPATTPTELPVWYSQFRFETNDKAWRAVALVDGDPVVIERRFGKGTVVLTTDSFFATNESLHKGSEPGFLLWLIGDNRKVIFDETTHGTVESGGAMKLIRRYRLHGVFFGLLFFVGLWAWRSASSLAPGSDDLDRGIVADGAAVSGEGTGSGLIRLLRRSIPAKDLLGQCHEIWSGAQVAATPVSQRKAIDEVLAEHTRNPKGVPVVEAYNRIVTILRRR